MYQALYRKYRPQSFDDVVGQNAVTQTLRNQVISGRLSHAYLFTGSHGTGKTTCAKIMAKAVNCENPIDGNPCNCCPACRGIDAGNVLDVQEIDAASNNGVDNVRTIRDDAVYPPAEVKKRVYIIDEVHMLSLAAFNALLKTIEEPPDHLMFILATTELNKVPATILSRCQRFAFRRPVAEDIVGRINYVAYQEGIDLAPEAAELLGRLADGAFRDGLSLLDQCASAATGTITVESIYTTLGLAGQQQTAEMMTAIAEKDAPKALKLFSDLYSQGKDAGSMLEEISTLARDLLLVKTAPQSGLQMISSTCTVSEVKELLPQFTPQELLRIIDLIQQTTGSFKTSLNQRLDGELCLMHLCDMQLSLDARDLSARISRVEEDLALRMQELERKIASGSIVVSSAPPAEDIWDEEAPPPWDDADAPPDPNAPEPTQTADAEPQDDTWQKIKERALPEIPAMVRCFWENNVSGTIRGDELILTPLNSMVKGQVDKPQYLDIIRKKAAFVMGRPIRVRFGDSGKSAQSDPLLALAKEMQGFDNMHVT